jgi:diguanylate cyclase (GGDEF)-like protein
VNELLEEARERPLPLVRQDEQPEKGQQEMDVLTRVNDLLDRKLFEATIINEISRLNTISEDSGITINSVLSVIAKVTDCYVGSVLLLEENEMIVHVHNPVGSNFFVEAKLRAIEAAKPYLPSGVSVKQIEVITDSDPGFIEGEKKGCDAIRSIYTSPLSARGKNIAVMTLLSPKPDTFTERVRSTLEIIEPPASVVVDNARLHQGAMKLAITDGLTHLFNHRHFYELLEQEFRRTNRYMSRMALIILDIDYFKKVNDNYGHQVGDDILKELAEVINGEVREIDLVARYGGEEFAVILPQTDTRQGVAVAERIRRNVERRSFYTPEGKIRITISAGVVSFPETAVESQVELVQLADEALYQAKESGRNKVVAGGRGDEA